MQVLSLWPLSAAEVVDSPRSNRADALFSGDWSALNVLPCDRHELIAHVLAGGFPDAAARTAGIAQSTLKRYYALLETLFLVLRHLQKTESAIFQRGIVLYAGREVVPFGNNLWALPLSVWWAV
jgi:predicted AAA+ superfamily ATPase